MTRVVVTGLGAVTPVGNTANDFLDGIFNSQVGIAPITKFDATETGVTVAGEVKGLRSCRTRWKARSSQDGFVLTICRSRSW